MGRTATVGGPISEPLTSTCFSDRQPRCTKYAAFGHASWRHEHRGQSHLRLLPPCADVVILLCCSLDPGRRCAVRRRRLAAGAHVPPHHGAAAAATPPRRRCTRTPDNTRSLTSGCLHAEAGVCALPVAAFEALEHASGMLTSPAPMAPHQALVQLCDCAMLCMNHHYKTAHLPLCT